MASLSLSNHSIPVERRLLSEFLQEPQEPFLFQMPRLGKYGAAGFLKRVLAKLLYGKTSSTHNRKSSAISCISDHSNDHQLSPVSVLALQCSNESSPSLHDHKEIEATQHDKSESFTKRRMLLLECSRKETEEKILSFDESLGCPDKFEKAMNELVFSWERPKADLINLTKLRDSDSSSSREKWNHLKPEATQIGLRLEAAIFDQLCKETILEMLVLHRT